MERPRAAPPNDIVEPWRRPSIEGLTTSQNFENCRAVPVFPLLRPAQIIVFSLIERKRNVSGVRLLGALWSSCPDGVVQRGPEVMNDVTQEERGPCVVGYGVQNPLDPHHRRRPLPLVVTPRYFARRRQQFFKQIPQFIPYLERALNLPKC